MALSISPFKARLRLKDATSRQSSIAIAFISALLIFLNFKLQASLSIDLADEGYLWYGAWRMLLGEIPMRDFQSYDPGRYAWSALWFTLLNDHGLISLRIANASFQFLGLIFGLLTLKRVVNSYGQLIFAGAVLSLWVYPSFKAYDHTISLAAVYFAVLLIEKPSLLRHFMAGLVVGLAAFFGRNHGIYVFSAYFLLILLIRFKLAPGSLTKRLLGWISGIIVGYSPMLLMIAFIPGFPEAFWESVIVLLNSSHTNIPLPVPWPWKFHPLWVPPLEAIHLLLIGSLFLLMPLFYIVGFSRLLIKNSDQLKQNAVLVAATLVGVFYAHYAFSRADLTHLALGMQPLLLGLMAIPAMLNFSSRKALAVLGTYTLLSAGQFSPFFMALTENHVTLDLNGDSITMDKASARVIRAISKINAELVGPNEQLLLAPNLTTLYPLLGRRSPLWEIYFLNPASQRAQQGDINTLAEQNTNWVFVMDRALDGRDALRFKNTHALLWQHFNDAFHPIKVEELPANYHLFQRR